MTEELNGRIQLAIIHELNQSPFFMDDFISKYYPDKKKHRKTLVRKSLRLLKNKHRYEILWFNYNGQGQRRGKRLKNKIPRFMIIFYEKDRLLAWGILTKKYPNILKYGFVWTVFGTPILDGLLTTTVSSGKKCIKGEEHKDRDEINKYRREYRNKNKDRINSYRRERYKISKEVRQNDR